MPEQAAPFVVGKTEQKRGRGDDVMKLTPKQEAFVDAYIETGNATEAARQAGYKRGSVEDAPNWLNPRKPQFKPYLDDAIKARQAEIKSARTATVTEVMEFLTSVMRGEFVEEIVVTEGCGDGISEARLIEKHPSISDRNKAAEHLLKRFGRPVGQEAEEQRLRIEKLRVEAEAIATVKNHAEQSVGMLQLVDSLNRARQGREDRDE